MRIYISGGMSGLPDLNFPAFDKARDRLDAEGHDVVSPADLERNRNLPTYQKKLVDDLIHLSHCDAIYMLRGWQNSKGARLELHFALVAGLEIRFAPDAQKKFIVWT